MIPKDFIIVNYNYESILDHANKHFFDDINKYLEYLNWVHEVYNRYIKGLNEEILELEITEAKENNEGKKILTAVEKDKLGAFSARRDELYDDLVPLRELIVKIKSKIKIKNVSKLKNVNKNNQTDWGKDIDDFKSHLHRLSLTDIRLIDTNSYEKSEIIFESHFKDGSQAASNINKINWIGTWAAYNYYYRLLERNNLFTLIEGKGIFFEKHFLYIGQEITHDKVTQNARGAPKVEIQKALRDIFKKYTATNNK